MSQVLYKTLLEGASRQWVGCVSLLLVLAELHGHEGGACGPTDGLHAQSCPWASGLAVLGSVSGGRLLVEGAAVKSALCSMLIRAGSCWWRDAPSGAAVPRSSVALQQAEAGFGQGVLVLL